MSKTKKVSLFFVSVLMIGFVLPEPLKIPVMGATSNDWNHNTFWYEPWGSSGVHKGIDIFGDKGTAVVSSTYGIVVYSDTLSKGGNVVIVLGPKWRFHYFAHLDSNSVSAGEFVNSDTVIGRLGDTGNALGKPPHLHYSIISIIPIPWLATRETQGWKRMFFLNPHKKLS